MAAEVAPTWPASRNACLRRLELGKAHVGVENLDGHDLRRAPSGSQSAQANFVAARQAALHARIHSPASSAQPLVGLMGDGYDFTRQELTHQLP